MTAGQTQQDQFKWSRTINRADELYQHDQMSDQPLPKEIQLSGVANMSNEEFQGKYVHFNVIPNSCDQCIDSKPLVHEIAPCHVTTTLHETPVYPQEPLPFSRQEHAQQAYASHSTTYQYPNSNVIPGQECLQPHIASTPGQIPYLHQNQLQSCLQQSKDSNQMMW